MGLEVTDELIDDDQVDELLREYCNSHLRVFSINTDMCQTFVSFLESGTLELMAE